MSRKFLFAILVVIASITILSCGGDDKKKDDDKTKMETNGTSKGSDDGVVPKIDTANLKDEASILDAMQKVVDARMADDIKQKDEPKYSGHYLELTKLYAAVLNASTAYGKTISDPAKAIEFSNKVSAIQDKMYANLIRK